MPCSTCDVRACFRGGSYPENCTADLCAPGARDEARELYAGEYRDVARAAYRTVVRSSASKWPRVQEVVAFAREMGFTKIGIASCISYADAAETLAALLRGQGFEVVNAMCKMGALRKSDVGLLEDGQRDGPLCNPVMQADALNRAGTEMNLVVGLCLGHDMLFNRHSHALCTTLAIKDQSLGKSAPFQAALEAWQRDYLN